MLRSKRAVAFIIGGYAAGLIAGYFISPFIAFLIPIAGTMVGSAIRQAELKTAARIAGAHNDQSLPRAGTAVAEPAPQPQLAVQRTELPGQGASAGSVPSDAAVNPAAADLGPEWRSILEYIGTIEDMVLLEGEKNNLDNEIVQRTLSLLVRLNRIIPQLVAFQNGDINHKIQRLVLKDLNGAINPFINLSGEAKRQNRRILLNSLKDIDSQISTYTSFLEQKDLMELKNKAELIHQRYGMKN